MVKNRGTGAGGAATNYLGKRFEEWTNNEERFIRDGYEKIFFNEKRKKGFYLSKKDVDKTIIYTKQYSFKKYIKKNYNIEIFRCPDEAYIFEYNNGRKLIKILEKKEQNVNGSVETKLWSGPSLKREYEIVLGEEIQICYGFCLSEFLKKKLSSEELKYKILKTILEENDITVLFGDDEDYFKMFDIWFNSSL